jgi:uncharacterized protein YraI
MRKLIPALLVALMLALLTGCNLSNQTDEQSLATATTFTGGKPTVTITQPKDGDEVVVGNEVLVSATATDGVGVQRVQLLANGQIVKTVSSESPSGDTSLNVLLDYTPRSEGDVTLQVIAFRGAISSDPAQITVKVRNTVAQVTATSAPVQNIPQIDPNDPTCRALVNIGLNLRQGPDTSYDKITVLQPGAVQPIVGRTGANDWWQLRVGTTIGWVSAQYTTVYGICTNVPVIAQPTAVLTSTPIVIPTIFIPPTIGAPATSAPTRPDLVVANISGPQSLSLPNGAGQVVGTYAVTISNKGGSPSGQFNNRLVVTPGDIKVPLAAVSGLNPGESIILTASVSFSAKDKYKVEAQSDSDGDVDEEHESNNNSSLNVTVSG